MGNTVGRHCIDLNKGWDFYLETLESREKSRYLPDRFTQINNKKTVDLPHDWSIEQEFTDRYQTEHESASLPGGVAWYAKTIPGEEMEAYVGKSVSLAFGGVYMSATVYINEDEVASNLYGYNSFSVDISEYFSVIQDIRIAVLVINRLPNSRWYSGSGIYRDVVLSVTEPVHLAENGLYISTPDLKNTHRDVVRVRCENELVNRSDHAQKIRIRNEIIDLDGNTVGVCDEKEFTVGSGKASVQTLYPQIEKPALWSVDMPTLYMLRSSVFADDTLVDLYTCEFGFRWIEYDNEKGFFFLNGEPVKLQGVCLHHDQGSLGAAAYPDAILRQLEIMKDMGANAIRTSHNPASEDLIKICNRLGLLVIEESFDTWDGTKNTYDFGALFKKELSGSALKLTDAKKGITWDEFVVCSMVKRDRNAPCVIMWSLGNEIRGENSRENAARLAACVEKTDPYKLTGRKKIYAEDDLRSGINDGWAEVIRGFSEHDGKDGELSVAGVNYIDAGSFEQIHKDYPDILMLSTESSSALRSRGEYFHPTYIIDDYNTDTPATENSQMSSYDNEVASWANTAMFDWQYDISLDYVLGEFVWTGFDYLGEPTPFTDNADHFYPTCSYFGIVDTAGFEKDIYYFYQSQWRSVQEKPVLHLLPDWELSGDRLDDGNALVVCYTNAMAVELRAKNESEDISLGVREFKTATSSAGLREYRLNRDENAVYKMALEWKLPYDRYKDHTLYAVPLDENGSPDDRFAEHSGRNTLKRSEAAAAINLCEYEYQNSLHTDREYELHYICVEVCDQNGTLCGNFNQNIECNIDGNAKIIGVDNGNSSDTDSAKYADKTGIRAFHAKALIIVKAETHAVCTLHVKSEELEAEIEIK